MSSSETAEKLPTRVLVAAGEGESWAVAAWLDEGGGVDAHYAELKGVTLLLAASAGGQEAMVRMLLQRGASVNLRDCMNITALMAAAVNGHTKIVLVLLDAKADASLQAIHGSTALEAAEEQKHTATAQLLRQHAKQQAPGRPNKLHPVSGTLSGSRVRIGGLKPKP